MLAVTFVSACVQTDKVLVNGQKNRKAAGCKQTHYAQPVHGQRADPSRRRRRALYSVLPTRGHYSD